MSNYLRVFRVRANMLSVKAWSWVEDVLEMDDDGKIREIYPDEEYKGDVKGQKALRRDLIKLGWDGKTPVYFSVC